MEDKGDKVYGGLHHPYTFKIKQEILTDDSSEPSQTLSGCSDTSASFSSIEAKQKTSLRLNSLKKSHFLNGRIKTLLEVEIKKMQALLEKSCEKQAILEKILKDDQMEKFYQEKPLSQVRAISVFAAPYFRDVKKMIPPENEDTKNKRKAQDVNAYLKTPRPWSKSENKKLLDGVTSFALLSALKPHKIKRDFLKNKLKDDDLLEFEIDILKKQLDSTEKKIKIVSEKSLHDLLLDIRGNIDWMTISAVHMEGTRTLEECENMWNNVLDFSINKETFTVEEDARIKNLAEDNQERDWDKIAKTLKTNRTAIQCFERYQTRLNSTLKKKYWTEDEDKKLLALIKEHKCGEIIPWNRISLLMEGRTRQQCINRYDRSISQIYNRAPWTTEEDALLIACYHKFRVHWAKMKDFFKKRSTYAIRERYVNALDPDIKMGSWTKDEDNILISTIKQYGWGKWSKICKKISGRTDNMCLVRASRLLEHSVKFFSDKGVEHNPNIDDPELFAKILKPIASSRNSPYRNFKLRNYRTKAIELLLCTLEKVIPDFKANREDLNLLDFSWLSNETLYQISEELHKNLNDDKYVSVLRYNKNRQRVRKRKYNENSDEDDDSQVILLENENILDTDKKTAESALRSMLEMKANILSSSSKRAFPAYTSRELAEMSLYKAYLYKQFQCLNVCDEEDNIENVTFTGINYAETLQTVVSFFIQPPVYENQFMVCAPNLSTMLGLETVEVTENRLLSMSECVSHSKSYVDYLCNRRKSCPKCLKCLSKDNQQGPSKVSAESYISNMKNKSFIVDKTMEDAAYIEAGLPERCLEFCSCTSLQESQKSVQLLRKRFMSLFLWPVLLASTDFNKEQENVLCQGPPKINDYYARFWNPVAGSEKRVYKKGKSFRQRKRNVKRNSKKPTTLSSCKKVLPKTAVNCNSTDEAVPKKRRKIIIPSFDNVRRSRRSCVLNRSTFAFEKKDSNKQEVTEPE